jgi:toxin ParE1/3/4
MAQINITSSAKKDLKSIADFIANDSIYYAERFINDLVERISVLEKHPEIGKPFLLYENIFFRRLIYEKYRIVYTYSNDIINVIRIVNQSKQMDEENLF